MVVAHSPRPAPWPHNLMACELRTVGTGCTSEYAFIPMSYGRIIVLIKYLLQHDQSCQREVDFGGERVPAADGATPPLRAEAGEHPPS